MLTLTGDKLHIYQKLKKIQMLINIIIDKPYKYFNDVT